MAKYADACNVVGGFENVKRKDEILRRHCEEVGRDESEIERTPMLFEHNGRARQWQNQLIGTPEQVAEQLAAYLGIGFRHFVIGFPSPYDADTMVRLVSEVKPLIEEHGGPALTA